MRTGGLSFPCSHNGEDSVDRVESPVCYIHISHCTDDALSQQTAKHVNKEGQEKEKNEATYVEGRKRRCLNFYVALSDDMVFDDFLPVKSELRSPFSSK